MRKNIYSLPALQLALRACHRRYLAFRSALELPLAGQKLLNRITRAVHEGDRAYRGLHFFSAPDSALLQLLARGEFNIQGFLISLL